MTSRFFREIVIFPLTNVPDECRTVDMSFHSDTLFRDNHSLLLLLICFTNFIVFSLNRPGIQQTIYRTRGERDNYNFCLFINRITEPLSGQLSNKSRYKLNIVESCVKHHNPSNKSLL